MTLDARKRTAIGSLVLAASTLVGLALSEGYSDQAIIPIPGDRPTKGFGATFNADGSPVRMGQTTTPPRALVDLLRDAGKYEQAVKRCAPVPMHPYEFSAYVQFTYNVGEGAFCRSTMARKLNALDYVGACAELSNWVYAQGKAVPGLVNRRNHERAECEGRTPS